MRGIVVMGVMGCGKTTVGEALSDHLGIGFIDGDSLHPVANVEKMARGEPLTDADRIPWLKDVGRCFAKNDGGKIIGCSALKRSYRDIIRQQAGAAPLFIHLEGSMEVLQKRVANRPGHFMPASLLESQLATLEPPQGDELAISCRIDQPLQIMVDDLVQRTTETLT